MKQFFRSLSSVWVQFKIFRKLKFVYPRRKKFRNIRSIIPDSLKIGYGIVMEENVQLTSYIREIGSHSYIGRGTYIGACSSIGKFTSISFDCKIGLVNHPLDFVSTSPAFYAPRRGWVKEGSFKETSNGVTEIGHDVLVSAGALILSGVKIGHGAVIGAGAVVNKDVAPYSIVAGVPAREIRKRFSDELIADLLKSEWWNMPDKLLREHAALANQPVEFLKAIRQETSSQS